MWSWFTFWLLLHILGAIVAFGPTFTFGLIGAQSAKEPMHAEFATRLVHMISKNVVIPVALSMAVTGVGLIFAGHVDLWGSEWLIIAIVVYVGAVGFSIAVQAPTAEKLIGVLQSMPPGPPPEGATGPPPAIAALTKRLTIGGIYLTVSVLVIVLLMIWRPGAAFS